MDCGPEAALWLNKLLGRTDLRLIFCSSEVRLRKLASKTDDQWFRTAKDIDEVMLALFLRDCLDLELVIIKYTPRQHSKQFSDAMLCAHLNWVFKKSDFKAFTYQSHNISNLKFIFQTQALEALFLPIIKKCQQSIINITMAMPANMRFWTM